MLTPARARLGAPVRYFYPPGLQPVATGPPAFFQASMPPSIWAAFASPASFGGVDRHRRPLAKAQKNTMRRPVAVATSRSIPPG